MIRQDKCGCGGETGSCAGGAPARAPSEALAAEALLRQCAGLLQHTPSQAYTTPSQILPGGTIGKHVRHLLDHIEAAANAEEVIAYDQRARDTAVESNVLVGLGVIDRLRRRLQAFSGEALARPVRVRFMVSADGAECETGSTLGRELVFATHHAVHHQAMIGAICRELGVPVDEGFGKAPSTAAHEAIRSV